VAPNASVIAALATSCRMVSTRSQVQLADKIEVFEFHLEWLSLCERCRKLTGGIELSKETQAQFDDLALRMAQYILNHE
jgi:hypothetical protein